MKGRHKQGIPREQAMLLPASVEDYVAADNAVRVIDAYVDSLELVALGFQHALGTLGAGQPPYDPRLMLKLYLYGYLMRVRTSRLLEREAGRNLELVWLLQGLRPSYKSIADFRRDNAQALKASSRDFVLMCKELDLYGGQLVAIDGSYFRGNVAKHSIYTKQRLDRMLKRIEKHIDSYLQELDEGDSQEAGQGECKADIAAAIEALKARQKALQGKLARLEKSGQTQEAEVDADARLLSKNGQTVAGYNVQIAVDEKYKLLVCSELTQDGNDTQQLAAVALQAKAVLEVDKLTVVADAGYCNAHQIKACEAGGVMPYVAIPDKQGPVNTEKRFGREQFDFDAQRNAYRCPEGQWLNPCGGKQQGDSYQYRYASAESVCAACNRRAQCLSARMRRREIYRSEHEALMESLRQRMQARGARHMRIRAGLVEHPFGTLKRWCGWLHFLVRGKKKVGGELALLTLCYNFRRLLTILGVDGLRKAFATRQMAAGAA